MTIQPARWARKLVFLLKRNRTLSQNVFIPSLILLIDILLRFGFRMDLSDAGADMALLAESALLAITIEDIRSGDPRDSIIEELLFVIAWIIVWLICLMVIADRIYCGPFKVLIACVIGLTSLVVASILLAELGARERDLQQTSQ